MRLALRHSATAARAVTVPTINTTIVTMAAALVGACLTAIAHGGCAGITPDELTAAISQHHEAHGDTQLVDGPYVAYVWRLLLVQDAFPAVVSSEAKVKDPLPPVTPILQGPHSHPDGSRTQLSLKELVDSHGPRLRLVLPAQEVYSRLTQPCPHQPITLSDENWRTLQLVARAGPQGIFLTQLAEQAGFPAKKAHSQIKSLCNQSLVVKFTTQFRFSGSLAPLAVYAPWAEAMARSLHGAETKARARTREQQKQGRSTASAPSPAPTDQDQEKDEVKAEILSWIQDPVQVHVPAPLKRPRRTRQTSVDAKPAEALDVSTDAGDQKPFSAESPTAASISLPPSPAGPSEAYYSYPQLVPAEGSRLMVNPLATKIRLLKLCRACPGGVVERFCVLHRLVRTLSLSFCLSSITLCTEPFSMWTERFSRCPGLQSHWSATARYVHSQSGQSYSRGVDHSCPRGPEQSPLYPNNRLG